VFTSQINENVNRFLYFNKVTRIFKHPFHKKMYFKIRDACCIRQFLKRNITYRISGRKTKSVQKCVTGNSVEMHGNWLRTACGRPILRPPATTRIRTNRQHCPAGRIAPAEPYRSRRAYCLCG